MSIESKLQIKNDKFGMIIELIPQDRLLSPLASRFLHNVRVLVSEKRDVITKYNH